jgi:hypothetical protein
VTRVARAVPRRPSCFGRAPGRAAAARSGSRRVQANLMSDLPLIDSLSACGNNESNIDNRIAAAVDELDHCVLPSILRKEKRDPAGATTGLLERSRFQVNKDHTGGGFP